ncbi:MULTISPECIES: glycosyltransferase family 2 protein [unclassified Sphingobacterium]|uniref:glycosyltransferase family 2 protein n=1 Tax=unclassified Sphingobacterium TaxID=2609468 RepID=UPI0025D0CBC0|nr:MULTISPECIES: glycosyltransferase family 2 protein [unclassified Sphingobacterium]
MHKFITVYTPTYNRGYCLGRLYESLINQTNKSFIWLIVDDGSTDETRKLVQKWILEGLLDIEYHYHENKGKMESLNFAHSIINTELCTCVDSDDYLTNDAIDFIKNAWDNIYDKNEIAGIVGLDSYSNGEIIGTSFPKDLNKSRFSDFEYKYHIKGDKKFVYRTAVIKEFPPYPNINGEKFPAPSYLYRLIDQKYYLMLYNKVLCIAEYLPDGLSQNKFLQYKKSAHSFLFYRKEVIRLSKFFIERFKNCMHYVSLCIFLKRNPYCKDLNPFLITISLPFGIILFLYLMRTKRKGLVGNK